MSPVTHLLVSWTFAEFTTREKSDCRAVAWAGVLPDADGLGLLIDLAYDLMRAPTINLYEEYHHMLFHGLFGAVLISLIMWMLVKKPKLFFLSFACVHVHLLCDLFGSRGPNPEDIWMIHYLEPFSERLTVYWSGQWELDGWQNIVFTICLLIFVFGYAAVRARSPVMLFHEKADRLFTDTVRKRCKR